MGRESTGDPGARRQACPGRHQVRPPVGREGRGRLRARGRGAWLRQSRPAP